MTRDPRAGSLTDRAEVVHGGFERPHPRPETLDGVERLHLALLTARADGPEAGSARVARIRTVGGSP
ncbi:hypothetical protein ACIBF6_35120 [Streptosporangium amethystogenes]|uniref:hypothetical protein n=1 Tax=Streptosporangium amethystogenes TaxID=2002 RepID=UPI0037BBC2FB